VRLRLEDCDLSTIGVSKLLECLTSAKKTLDMLSVADNPLGKSVISFFSFPYCLIYLFLLKCTSVLWQVHWPSSWVHV
jgi:hypothetical protein